MRGRRRRAVDKQQPRPRKDKIVQPKFPKAMRKKKPKDKGK